MRGAGGRNRTKTNSLPLVGGALINLPHDGLSSKAKNTDLPIVKWDIIQNHLESDMIHLHTSGGRKVTSTDHLVKFPYNPE